MTELTRLRELAALFRPKVAPIQEEVSALASFDGITAIVNDALGDLADKLGEGGSLETLLDKQNLSGLDSLKDGDGKTMLSRLAIRTAQYTKEVNDVLLEIELMLSSS